MLSRSTFSRTSRMDGGRPRSRIWLRMATRISRWTGVRSPGRSASITAGPPLLDRGPCGADQPIAALRLAEPAINRSCQAEPVPSQEATNRRRCLAQPVGTGGRRYRAHLSDPRGQDRVRGSAQNSALLWFHAAAGPFLAVGSTGPARSPWTLGAVGGPQCADIACALMTSLVAAGGDRESAAQFADRGEFLARHPFGQAV